MDSDTRTPPLPLPHPAKDALARRQRARAARVLAGAGSRASIEWTELSRFPEWAFASAAVLDTLAWAAGAWRHGDALRRCIDGRLLDLVHKRLGSTAFAYLMDAPVGESAADKHTLDIMRNSPQLLDETLRLSGREWLLASVDSSSLRRCLRELWWPDMPQSDIPAAWHGKAREDMAAVVGHCLQREDASS